MWGLESEYSRVVLGRWAGESVGARPLTFEMYRIFVSWGLIDSFVGILIMVVLYKLILIFFFLYSQFLVVLSIAFV